jgi:hypothetical protein
LPGAEGIRCGHTEQTGELALEIQGAVGRTASHVPDLVKQGAGIVGQGTELVTTDYDPSLSLFPKAKHLVARFVQTRIRE